MKKIYKIMLMILFVLICFSMSVEAREADDNIPATDGKTLMEQWDKKIYGTGDKKVICTWNSEENFGKMSVKEAISFVNKKANISTYTGMKKDIMRNKVIIAMRQNKSPAKNKKVEIEGMPYITQKSVYDLTSEQQKAWKKEIETYIEKANSYINTFKGKSAYEKSVSKRRDDAKQVLTYLKSAMKNNKNSDNKLGNVKIGGEDIDLSDQDASVPEESEAYNDAGNYENTVYENQDLNILELPERNLGYYSKSNKVNETTADELISDADDFIKSGDNTNTINQSKLSKTVKSLYNILLAISIVLAVIVGTYLAIKVMISSVEEKAKIKELFIPYVIGCIVAFGAFGIWALVMKVFNSM